MMMGRRGGRGIVLAATLALFISTGASADCAHEARRPDPVLDGLIARALDSSPELELARAERERGAAGISMAQSPYRPELGLGTGFTKTDDPTSAFSAILEQGRLTPEVQSDLNDPPPVGDWATHLYARILLFDSGRRKADTEAARSEEDRLRLLEEATLRDVRYAVSSAYYDLIRSRAAVGLWEDTVRLFGAHRDLTLAGFEAGTVLRSDVLSIEVRLSEAEENLITARSDAEIALALLASTIGMSRDAVEVPDRPIDCPVYGDDEAEIVGRAMDAHPAIAAIDAAGRAAASGERARRRDDWPKLVGEVRGIWHGDDESLGVERGSYVASVMLDVPIYDGGRSLAAAEGSTARRREVEAARRRVALDLELAARTAHRRAREQVDRVAIADRAVEAAEAALRIIEERYEAGLATIVHLIEAERAVTGARVRALDARALGWTAVARIEQIAGPEPAP